MLGQACWPRAPSSAHQCIPQPPARHSAVQRGSLMPPGAFIFPFFKNEIKFKKSVPWWPGLQSTQGAHVAPSYLVGQCRSECFCCPQSVIVRAPSPLLAAPPIPEPPLRTPGIHHRPQLLPPPGHAPSAGSVPTAAAQRPPGNQSPNLPGGPGPTPAAHAAHSQCICEVSPPCAASCAPPACTGL